VIDSDTGQYKTQHKHCALCLHFTARGTRHKAHALLIYTPRQASHWNNMCHCGSLPNPSRPDVVLVMWLLAE